MPISKHRFQLASSTDHPIGPGTKLWRYLSFEKFVWLLEESSMYFTRLDKLGDPFEGSITKQYAANRDSGQGAHFSLPELEPYVFQRLLFCSYVSCWHASRHESAAMWKLYSSENAGVALISSPERFRDACILGPYGTAFLQPVEYLDFDTHTMRLPFGKVARPGLCKRKSFEHEREVRGIIIADTVPGKPTQFAIGELGVLEREMPLGISIKVKLPRLIESIRISPLAPQYFVDLVSKVAKRRGVGNHVVPSSLNGTPIY